MNITQGKIGHTYEVIQVGGKEKYVKFLSTLGLFPGVKVTIVNILAGNYILNIKDSRYAIDHEMSKGVIIREMQSGSDI